MENPFANAKSAPRLARDYDHRAYVTYDDADTLRYVYVDRSIDTRSQAAVSESVCIVSRMALEDCLESAAHTGPLQTDQESAIIHNKLPETATAHTDF